MGKSGKPIEFLEHLRADIDSKDKRMTLTFGEFLEVAKAEPQRVLRNIFQLFYDMVKGNIIKGKDEYLGDPESIGFVPYDCSKIFVEDADSPFFPDRLLANRFAREIEILEAEKNVTKETKKQIGKMQKELFLREQLKSIEKELGVDDEKGEAELLKSKIVAAGMPKDVKEKALKELNRLSKMPPFNPEISYLRTYLDLLTELPWLKKEKEDIDLKQAEKILNQDHYGLNKVKERVLEYLAVQKQVGKLKGPILCLVGPPGTGKTSVGQSIARALGRKFVRVSLGGLRDEAEIRGHRRTYVGAMPGRIIQGVHNAKVVNPVFMLDEIDKIGMDFRGDPSAALLEALDPQQNHSFSDHYLEVPYDLSDVMFITTANILDTIPPALRDRWGRLFVPG